MKILLFALAAMALLAEPASAATPFRMAPQDAVVGVGPTLVVTRAGVAHRSSRRTTRRVMRRH